MVLVGNHKDVVLAAVEYFAKLLVGGDVFAVFVHIHRGFGERFLAGIIIQGDLARKSDHYISTAALFCMVGNVFLDGEIIANCVCAAVSYDHGFALAANLVAAVYDSETAGLTGFIVGNTELNEENWNAFIEQMDSLGLSQIEQIQLEAYQNTIG